jgi:hypothetical protein
LLAVVTTLSGRGGAGAAALVLAPDVDALTGNALMTPFHCALRCASVVHFVCGSAFRRGAIAADAIIGW